MEPQLIPLTKPDRLLAAGLPWDTEGKARWAFRKRHENGLAAAFVRIGKKNLFVDPNKAHDILRNQAG